MRLQNKGEVAGIIVLYFVPALPSKTHTVCFTR